MIDTSAIHSSPVSPLEIARRLGLEVARGSRDEAVKVKHHGEQTPSCSIQRKGGRVVWHCHGCGEGGDLIGLVADVHGINSRERFVEAAHLAASLVGVTLSGGQARAPKKDPALALALAIENAADNYRAGRRVLPSDTIEQADPLHILEALRTLADADALENEELDRREAELEVMEAPAW